MPAAARRRGRCARDGSRRALRARAPARRPPGRFVLHTVCTAEARMPKIVSRCRHVVVDRGPHHPRPVFCQSISTRRASTPAPASPCCWGANASEGGVLRSPVSAPVDLVIKSDPSNPSHRRAKRCAGGATRVRPRRCARSRRPRSRPRPLASPSHRSPACTSARTV
jgi:hypothetical protein